MWKTISNDELFHRMNFACVVYNDRYIIIAGGNEYTSGEGLRSVISFDTHEKIIKEFPDLPEISWTCTGTILKGCFYVAGHHGSIFRLDLSLCEAWEQVTSSGDLFGHTIVSDDEHLYSIGGRNTDGIITSPCRRFCPKEDTWIALPQMNQSRYRHAVAIIGKQIYVIGGVREKQEKISSVEVYNINSMTWDIIANIPAVPNESSDDGLCLSCAALATFDKMIVLTGGRKRRRSTGIISPYCFVLNTHNLKWMQSMITLPTARSAHGCVLIGGTQLFLIGGESQKSIEAIERKCFFPNWYIIQDFLLLHKLVEEDRASIKRHNGGKLCMSDEFVQKLMTNLNLDLCRHVVSFLV